MAYDRNSSVSTTVISGDTIRQFTGPIQDLADRGDYYEVDRLLDERYGIDEPKAVIAVRDNSLRVGSPELVCVLPIEERGTQACLGSYYPRRTSLTVARFAIHSAVEYLVADSAIQTLLARTNDINRPIYEVLGFSKPKNRATGLLVMSVGSRCRR